MNLHRPAWYSLVCIHTVHFRLYMYVIRSFGTEGTHDNIIIVKESRHKHWSFEPVSCIYDSSSSAVIEMSDHTRKLFSARKFRGTVRGMITRLEAQISKLEAKPEIT